MDASKVDEEPTEIIADNSTQQEEEEKKTFECSVCDMCEKYDYFGTDPQFTKPIRYTLARQRSSGAIRIIFCFFSQQPFAPGA